ncbi:MAG: hypothetical protein J0I99_16480 [Devosia sp.]|uniref:hypothetical protein n=1 Tax=Devosia sp. TaxID=1871048 RepID=UPI001AD4BC7F|nr:hypothetical protein [Devosia sp.]MBN9317341.1 hypothetical protein [Devosia sp.]
MFLLRSAFWLTVMFLIIAPRNHDLGKDVANASQQALEAGQKAIVAQILSGDCTSLECAGGKAALTVLAGNKLPSIGVPMQDNSNIPVPLPRPRPDRMG